MTARPTSRTGSSTRCGRCRTVSRFRCSFFAAGVTVVCGGLGDALVEPVTIGVIAGLVLGKVVGVFGATYLLARFTKAQLDEDLAWIDVLGLSLLTGIGFTVSLLIGELSYGADPTLSEDVKIAVLAGSLLAAALAEASSLLNDIKGGMAEREDQLRVALGLDSGGPARAMDSQSARELLDDPARWRAR